jgi:uncharacterized delta-60 repeat protein
MRGLVVALAVLASLAAAVPAAAGAGDLDHRFGHRGIIDERAPEGGAEIAELLPMPGGGVLAVARTYRARLALLKYRANGTRDAGFGRRGLRIHSLSDTVGEISSAARGPDGRILVGYANSAQFGDWIVARFLPDGRLDRSFGTHGLLTHDLGAVYLSAQIVVRPDGRAVLAFEATDDFEMPRRWVDLLALTRGGQPDTSFGDAGRATIERPDGSFSLHDIALGPDGRLVTIGEEYGPDGTNTYVNRLAADGRAQRLVRVPYAELPSANVEVLRNGDVVVAESSHVPSNSDSFVLSVFSPFGGALVTHRVSFGNRRPVADELMVDRRGRIVIGGTVGEGLKRLALARFLPSGKPDSSFGTRGAALGPRAGRPGITLTAVARGPGDTILASATPFSAFQDRVLITRFHGR